jgi:hypothetical protein
MKFSKGALNWGGLGMCIILAVLVLTSMSLWKSPNLNIDQQADISIPMSSEEPETQILEAAFTEPELSSISMSETTWVKTVGMHDTIDKYRGRLSRNYILAVIATETGGWDDFSFNAEKAVGVVSWCGAVGLMQIMEGGALAQWNADHKNDYTIMDMYDPELNIMVGCYYLNWCWTKIEKLYGNYKDFSFEGYYKRLYAMYNSGPKVRLQAHYAAYKINNSNTLEVLEQYYRLAKNGMLASMDVIFEVS